MFEMTHKISDYKIYKVIDTSLGVTYHLKISNDMFIRLCCIYAEGTLSKITKDGTVYTGLGAQLIAELIKIQGYETNTLDVLVATGFTENDLQHIFEKAYTNWWKKN